MAFFSSSTVTVRALPVVGIVVGCAASCYVLWHAIPAVHRPTWGLAGIAALVVLAGIGVLCESRFECMRCHQEGGLLFASRHRCESPAEEEEGEAPPAKPGVANRIASAIASVLIIAVAILFAYLLINALINA